MGNLKEVSLSAQSGCYVYEKYMLSLQGIEACGLVIILTEILQQKCCLVDQIRLFCFFPHPFHVTTHLPFDTK